MDGQKTPWPTRWLMTDERIADIDAALDALPMEAGVVLRHDSRPRDERQRMAAAIRSRGLLLAVAGDVALAREVGAALVHRPVGDPGAIPYSLPVHDEAEARAASGAALVFVSPVYTTRSHEGRQGLGPEGAAALARTAGIPAIALGGVDDARFERDLRSRGFHGWAGIDAWTRR